MYASSLESFSAEVARSLSARLVVGVVGDAIGSGQEYDAEPGISLLAGALPEKTSVTPFVISASRLPTLKDLFKELIPSRQSRK